MFWEVRESRPCPQWGETREDILEEGAFTPDTEEWEGF